VDGASWHDRLGVVSSVLIVDDDPAFLDLAARIVRELGIPVVVRAPDAATAIRLAEETRPEGALVDVGLPDRDGIDLAYELATLPWKPTVVLTSSDGDAAAAIVSRPGVPSIPFVPKDSLTNGSLPRHFGREYAALDPYRSEEYRDPVTEREQLRVVIGEDDVLLREGIARILVEVGFDVVSQAGDAESFLRKALAHRPDVAVVDIQMPPGHQDDGLRAALELRRSLPDTGVLVLSTHYDDRYAADLIGDSAEGVGYLLKERVGDVEAFTSAVARVAAGGSALDPEVVARMLGRRQVEGPLADLSPRERDVLAQLAEGKSNQGIADALFVTSAAVEKHVTSIFHKLHVDAGPSGHKRVLAAITYLRNARS
jgi:DNA-binding NarL/FixJ family response regulator